MTLLNKNLASFVIMAILIFTGMNLVGLMDTFQSGPNFYTPLGWLTIHRGLDYTTIEGFSFLKLLLETGIVFGLTWLLSKILPSSRNELIS
jgi:hypothetical protein